MMNIASPVVTLLTPLIMMILPFFMIRSIGLPVTFAQYFSILKNIIGNHAIGKIFTRFSFASTKEKVTILLSAGFYIYSFYQNVLTCWRFQKNMAGIHVFFKDINEYLHETLFSINAFLEMKTIDETSSSAWKLFIEHLKKQQNVLLNLYEKTNKIKGDWSIIKIMNIGSILKLFYELHSNIEIHESIIYSFGFHGYIDTIKGLAKNIFNKKLHYAKFITNKNSNKNSQNNKTIIKQNYYAFLRDEKPIKNNICLDQNMIITGPNASGKTTIMKSILINLIISQQLGVGFYGKDTKIIPYTHFHSYLNIPDTSGRDSLFQAEARRCKEIIDIIENNDQSNAKHFCIFDELFSGTNPKEAVKGSVAFMRYLSQYPNVHVILTTHFIQVCKNINSSKCKNYHMKVIKEKNDDTNHYKKLKMTYLLKKGLSKIKGGVNVLREMNYPESFFSF
jgi:hypothetical protein